MIYRAYRFPDEETFLSAVSDAQPMEMDVIGPITTEAGDPIPGWYVNAIWPEVAPISWASHNLQTVEAPRWWVGVSREDPFPAVPNKVTPRQLREALLDVGILDVVEAIVAASDRATQIRWEYAVEFERAHPQWDIMAAMMDPPMGPSDIDAIFQLALTK